MKATAILVLTYLLLASCATQVDIADTKRPNLIDAADLDDYFTTLSNSEDGGEIEFRFSNKFVEMIPEHCRLNAHVKLHNQGFVESEWVQISAISFVNMESSQLAKQSFYVAGLGNSLTLELDYDMEGECSGRGDKVQVRILNY